MKSFIFSPILFLAAASCCGAATIFTSRSSYDLALGAASSYVIKAPPVASGDYWESDVTAGDATYRVAHPVTLSTDYYEIYTGFNGSLVSMSKYDFLYLNLSGSHNAVEFNLSKFNNAGGLLNIQVNGQNLGSVSVPNYPASAFVGIISETPVTSLLIEDSAPLAGGQISLVGERFVAVPEPASLALLGFGGAFSLMIRRRARARQHR